MLRVWGCACRNGQKNGFNFNEHKNDKIGILRSFNKRKSTLEKDK